MSSTKLCEGCGRELTKSDTITAWRCTRGEENPRVDHCECCYEDEKPLKLYEPRNEWLCPRCHEWIKYWDSLTPEQQRHEQRLMAAYGERRVLDRVYSLLSAWKNEVRIVSELGAHPAAVRFCEELEKALKGEE